MIGVQRGVARHIHAVRAWKRTAVVVACLLGFAGAGGLAGAMQSEHSSVEPDQGTAVEKQQSTVREAATQPQVEAASTGDEPTQTAVPSPVPAVQQPIPEPAVIVPDQTDQTANTSPVADALTPEPSADAAPVEPTVPST